MIAAMTARETPASESLYRSGAERDVSFRHSVKTPRLNAAFVAQLLGQTMPERAPQASARSPPIIDRPRMALVCDRCL